MEKTALITGGSSGLGFAFAKNLGKQGYRVIIISRDKGRIDKAVTDLQQMNISAEGFSCDVSDDRQLRELQQNIVKKYPVIDFLVLNAGIVTTKLLTEYEDMAEIRKDIDTDLYGIIFSAHTFLPMLKPGSRILMTSSGFGIMGAAGYSIYCAAKAGVVNFAEALRRELLVKGIRVYVAVPGDMDTPQFRQEVEHSPDWMKTGSPRKCLPVDFAANRIIRRCRGKYKFLIISSADVRLLHLVTKFAPRKLRDYLLDKMMPRPK